MHKEAKRNGGLNLFFLSFFPWKFQSDLHLNARFYSADRGNFNFQEAIFFKRI